MLAALAGVVLSGCLQPTGGIADQSQARRRMKEHPVQILDGKAKGVESTDAGGGTLMDALKRQQEALEARKNSEAPAVESSAPAAAVESTDAAALVERPERAKPPVPAKRDMSVDALVAELAAKPDRSPAEEEAYRRLRGAGQPQAALPGDAEKEYKLLGEARDALVKGETETAKAKTSEALRLVRRRTDPVIDRVCFATKVRNYGDADLVEPATFAAGQKVLVVADISDFACLPSQKSSPPEFYYTKMSNRLVIYDTKGKLYWQNSYGAFEYQSAHYINTMFIPHIFDLPKELAAGEYVLKVEISDILAARQAESSANFTVK